MIFKATSLIVDLRGQRFRAQPKCICVFVFSADRVGRAVLTRLTLFSLERFFPRTISSHERPGAF